MAYEKRFLGAADVMVDKETGALLVGLPVAPATEAKQDALISALGGASDAFAITQNNDADLAHVATVFVGTGGDLKVTTAGGTTVTFTNLPDGILLPVRVARVFATGTSASDLVGLFD